MLFVSRSKLHVYLVQSVIFSTFVEYVIIRGIVRLPL